MASARGVALRRAAAGDAKKEAMEAKKLPVPPTLDALARLEASIDEPLTSRAKLLFSMWKTSISSVESD